MAEIAVAVLMLAGAGGGLWWYLEEGKTPVAKATKPSTKSSVGAKVPVTVPLDAAAAPTGTTTTSIGATPITQTTIQSTIVPQSSPISPADSVAAAASAPTAAPTPAPAPCVTSDWGAWGACDPNMGQQQRTRTVTSGDCTGVDLVATQNCAVDAVAGPWGNWGTCDQGNGTQTRTRSVQSESINGGAPASSLQLTDAQPCPVDCQVGSWGNPEGTCSGGKQTQSRSITVQPLNGGAACPGLQQQIGCQDPLPRVQNQRIQWGDNSGRYLGCYGGTCTKGSWVKSQAIGGISGSKNGQMFTYNSNNTITSGGQCLDVKNSGTGNGTQVDTFTCNNTGAQVWQWDWAGDHYRLKNPHSGRCLDVPNGGNTQDGIGMQIWDCGSAAGQKWSAA